MVLKGSEVKSLRESKVTISETYARIHNDELWLYGLHIGQYSSSSARRSPTTPIESASCSPTAPRSNSMRRAIDHDGRTLVPLQLYFKDGRAKIEIAIARRRRSQDKREAIRRRESELEARRAMADADRR